MKKSKSIAKLIMLPLILLIFFWAWHGTISAPENPLAPQEPQAQPQTEAVNSQPSVKQSVTKPAVIKPQTVDAIKHPSEILAANPAAIEYEYYLMATTNDPQLGSSWHLSTIQADRAWDVTTGSSNTVVAVIDSPFALSHEDLVNKWKTNSGETGNTQNGDTCWDGSAKDKSTNSCDDDENGYIDDWRGYDFINDDNNVQAGLTNPTGESISHGTLVAGTVAATANNSKGSVGVDQNATIMPLQVFDDDGNATTTDIVAAVEYAYNNGATVINMSLGSNGNDPLLLAAIKAARAKGIMVVVAGGNCALNDQPICYTLTPPGRVTYPAVHPEVVAVGATASNDTRASFSSYSASIDVVAPGVNVGPIPTYTQANPTTAYATASGTSFSSPIVAGIAALIKAQFPAISLLDWEASLKESTEHVAGLNGWYYNGEYGFGRVNAHRATLLAKAKAEPATQTLNATSLTSSTQAVGKIWRSYASGNVADDESILIGCKVYSADRCNATIVNGSIYNFPFDYQQKIGPLKYWFVKGTEVPAGTWNIFVNNNNQSVSIGSVTR